MTHYLEEIFKCSSRLINLVDKNEFSKSFGCFDRSYWHYKTRSFPNAASQQGLLSLAKLYILNEDNNDFYMCPELLRIISGVIKYTKKIQHNDGSFDEWYPNERGAAGPTGYLCHTFCDTYWTLEKYLDEKERNTLLDLLSTSAGFLVKSRERHKLANHVAIAMLGLYEAYSITNEEKFFNRYNELFAELESLYSTEGWSTEYDGADPGYQTATVSFLSRIFVLSRDMRLEKLCKNSIDFISIFCYPDGTFGGNIGSRHTTNIFYFGIEFWSAYEPGAKISQWIKDNFKNQTLPSSHDDIYFLYRVYELIDAHQYYNPRNVAPLLYKSKDFSEAGIKVIVNDNIYFVCNLKRGGCFQVYDVKKRKLIDYDSGVLVEQKNKSYTSLSVNSHNSNQITKKLVLNETRLFTPITQSLFFVFMTFLGSNYKIAARLKYLIRSILIVFSKSSTIDFVRDFVFNEKSIVITTKVVSSKNIESIKIGGEHFSRYVPQSRYSNTLNKEKNIKWSSNFKKIVSLKKINLDDLSIRIDH